MRQLFSLRTWCCVVVLAGACALVSVGAPQGTLSVGAARVDVTPPPDAALPMSGYSSRKQGFQKIHDHIYARAIVLSDGTHEAAVLSWELIGMPEAVWQELSQRISKELGIPADNLILAGEHVHSAPTVAGAYTKGTPPTIAYTEKLEDAAFEAVKQAKAKLQPARFGFSVGANGMHYFLTSLELAPHETRAINIRQLRDAQIADFKGHRIPGEATDGGVN